jgi:hypothetical protein
MFMLNNKLKYIQILFLIGSLIFLIGWAPIDVVETSMKELGFKLKKKENINIPYTDNSEIRYTFVHRVYPVVIINEYPNGFIEIRANYRSQTRPREQIKWDLTVRRTIEKQTFRETIYRIFVLGDNK